MPPESDLEKLRATLGAPALTRLVDALVLRLARGRPLHGRITLSAASTVERAALDGLLGRRSSAGRSLHVDLDALAVMLEHSAVAPDLVSAVTALRGRVANRREDRAIHAQTWESVASAAGEQFQPWPDVAAWGRTLVRAGVLKRLARSDAATALAWIRDLARLCAVLPARAEPLASLAARLYGDAHALDPGTPRGTLAVRAAARLGHVSFSNEAEGRRMAWGSVGVLCDELSTPLLVFNLPSDEQTPLGRLLRVALADAQPVHLSLRALMRWPLDRDAALKGRIVFVCENPTVVALAADRLGSRCAPLLSVGGQFATPALLALRQLRTAGARLRYHGDFDPAGLVIARRAMAEGGALPWRYDTASYLAASAMGVSFLGTPGATPWDPSLGECMRRDGRGVHEEAVFDGLAEDLAGPVP